MFKTNNEQSTNLRQSGNSAASQNYEQRSSINIRAPGMLGGEGPGDNGNGGVCRMHFERARRDYAIYRASDSGSFRRRRLVGPTCAGCVASLGSSGGYEILNNHGDLPARSSRVGGLRRPPRKAFGVARLPYCTWCFETISYVRYYRGQGRTTRISVDNE